MALLLFTTFIVSYPISVLFDRGNIEGILFIFIAAGIWLYRKEHFYTAAIFLAIPAACKFYPAIFYGLYILNRQWRSLLLGITAILCLTVFSFVILPAPISLTINQFLNNISEFNNFFLFDGGAIQFGHSLCTLVRGTVFADYNNPKVQESLRVFLKVYPYFVGILTLVVFWRLRESDAWTRVCVLTVMMLFFPFVSSDLKLVYLYIPFVWLLLGMGACSSLALLDLLPVCVLAFITIPKQYLVGLFGMGPGLSFILNGLALGLLLLLLVARKRWDGLLALESRSMFTRS